MILVVNYKFKLILQVLIFYGGYLPVKIKASWLEEVKNVCPNRPIFEFILIYELFKMCLKGCLNFSFNCFVFKIEISFFYDCLQDI